MNYEIIDTNGTVIATRVPESDLEAWLAEGDYSFRPQTVMTQEERTTQGVEEATAMNENIATAQQQAQQEELANEPFLTRFAKSGLRTLRPYSAELMETNPDASAFDRLKASTSDATALGTQLALPATSLLGKLGLGATNVMNDISSQFSNDNLGTLRNVLNVGINSLPLIGNAGNALKWIGKESVTNTFLPIGKQARNPNPPDFGKGLDEGLFSGFGKYSALDKINEKTAPIIARLEDLKSQGMMIDIQEARNNAMDELRRKMAGAGEGDYQQARAQLDDWFTAEKQANKYVSPEVTHMESQFDPTAFETARRATKAKETRARKSWLNSGDPEALPPFIEYPKKTQAPFWEQIEVVDQPETTSFLYDVPTALEKKTYSQNKAFGVPDADLKEGQFQNIAKARGINKAIESSAPEVRQATRDLAPYYAMQKAIEYRQGVGGSNAPISLKDIAYASQFNPALFLPALLGSKFVRSPQGAQSAFNIGKAMNKAGKPTTFASIAGQRVLPSWLDNQGE